MTKVFKRIAVLLFAVISTVCIAAFASACNDDGNQGGNGGNQYATTSFTVTVLDENGSPINGPEFGEDNYDPDVHQVYIQFCTVLPNGTQGACWGTTSNIDANGKVTIQLAGLKTFMQDINEDSDVTITTFELHVRRVANKGYVEEYEDYRYTVDTVPMNITVTLKKA